MLLLMHRHRSNDAESTPPAVFVRPDLTKLQTQKDYRLREELKRLGKDRYRISNGRIVPRNASVPGRQQSTTFVNQTRPSQLMEERHSKTAPVTRLTKADTSNDQLGTKDQTETTIRHSNNTRYDEVSDNTLLQCDETGTNATLREETAEDSALVSDAMLLHWIDTESSHTINCSDNSDDEIIHPTPQPSSAEQPREARAGHTDKRITRHSTKKLGQSKENTADSM